MSELYTYAVARIRAKELSLLGRQEIEQLMACKSEEACIRLLEDKGWETVNGDAQAMLNAELDKTWEIARELVPDVTVFSVFFLPMDCNNIKAAIKAAVTGVNPGNLFLARGSIPPKELEEAVRRRDFSALPSIMKDAAEEAFQVLLKTQDGQLCDIILDQACLFAIQKKGEQSDSELLRNYAELVVALMDLKIIVRCIKTGKNAEFMRRATIPCKTIQIESLISAALKGPKELEQYLFTTKYAQAAEAFKISYSAFEKWCDNAVIALIQAEKTNPFTIGPVAAYVLARENEIKIIRLILSAKRNGLDDQIIKERVRDLYV